MMLLEEASYVGCGRMPIVIAALSVLLLLQLTCDAGTDMAGGSQVRHATAGTMAGSFCLGSTGKVHAKHTP